MDLFVYSCQDNKEACGINLRAMILSSIEIFHLKMSTTTTITTITIEHFEAATQVQQHQSNIETTATTTATNHIPTCVRTDKKVFSKIISSTLDLSSNAFLPFYLVTQTNMVESKSTPGSINERY